MPPEVGTMTSVGTGGWWVDAAGTPTGQPTLAAGTVGAATATLVLTPPVAADYARSDVLLIADGAAAWTTLSSYHVAGDPAGGAAFVVLPNTWYTAIAQSYNTGGLRSLPSAPPVRFKTLISEAGTYLATIKLFTDQSAVADVIYVCNLALGYHRIPWDVRGATGSIQISFSVVGKNVEFTGSVVSGTTLGRRD
jgi:hypothetical protein